MYSIENSYNPMIEALLKGVQAGQGEYWMASIAWWLGRQDFFSCRDYWFTIAGRLTAELPTVQRARIIDQLGKQEDAYVDNPPTTWPELPSAIHNLLAEWNPAPVEPDLAAMRLDAIAKIDRDAEKYRLNFITAGDGQQMTYQLKFAEARLAVAEPAPDPADIPHIVAEATVDGVTTKEKGQEIIATFERWHLVSASIEAKRMGAKKAVAEALTAEAITAAVNVDWAGA